MQKNMQKLHARFIIKNVPEILSKSGAKVLKNLEICK